MAGEATIIPLIFAATRSRDGRSRAPRSTSSSRGLPAASPLWAMEHVLITPHTAGETYRYEDNVLAILQENLARLWRGETELLNQVV